MESVVVTREFWHGKRVFLSGHTGFKGAWLALWLTDMGAEVHGYALVPPTNPNFFEAANLRSSIASSTNGDIRDASLLTRAMQEAQPHIVLHLAAQSLVRYSYISPVETYAVNVMGTVNLLEAVRSDRNLYRKSLIEQKNEMLEYKRKYGNLSMQIKQLKQEIAEKVCCCVCVRCEFAEDSPHTST